MTEYKVGDLIEVTDFDSVVFRDGQSISMHDWTGTIQQILSDDVQVRFPGFGILWVGINQIKLFVRSGNTATVEEKLAASDPVNGPDYYKLPNGREVIEISQWLNAAGSQAVQYIARATRIDGVVKDEPLQDIEKAIFWLEIERERLKQYAPETAASGRPDER